MAQKIISPEAFTSEVCAALPGQIRSVVLFGSAAAGDFVSGTSGYDLLIVIDQIAIAELNSLAKIIQRWYRQGNPLPLLFASDQLALSTDAFAAEFLEMKQSRRVLFGSDPIAEMEIDPAHVRMHLERELKGKLLALRNRYALAAGHRRQIVRLLTESYSTFLSLFRVALRLYQPEVPTEKMDALRALATHLPIHLEPFVMVDEIRRGDRRAAEFEINVLFSHYCQAVESIVHAIDHQLHLAP